MKKRLKRLVFAASCLVLAMALVGTDVARAYTANKVWFTFLPNGRYRVNVVYTVPALKEFRESYVEFTRKREAEAFYWQLVRGADFYPSDPSKTRYQANPTKPEPW